MAGWVCCVFFFLFCCSLTVCILFFLLFTAQNSRIFLTGRLIYLSNSLDRSANALNIFYTYKHQFNYGAEENQSEIYTQKRLKNTKIWKYRLWFFEWMHRCSVLQYVMWTGMKILYETTDFCACVFVLLCSTESLTQRERWKEREQERKKEKESEQLIIYGFYATEHPGIYRYAFMALSVSSNLSFIYPCLSIDIWNAYIYDDIRRNDEDERECTCGSKCGIGHYWPWNVSFRRSKKQWRRCEEKKMDASGPVGRKSEREKRKCGADKQWQWRHVAVAMALHIMYGQ